LSVGALALLTTLPSASSGPVGESASAIPAITKSVARDPTATAAILAEARELQQLHSLIVARDGKILLDKRFRGPALDEPVNIKSASKSIIAAMIGRAIAEGMLEGVDQRIAPFFAGELPRSQDRRLDRLTIGHLLSMQSGLERTSGGNYGKWVASRNWVRFVLSRPFVDEPGGKMLYSTGNTHLLSAILAKASGRSTRDLFMDWFGEPLGIRVGAWDRDPQGIHFGGNNMALSPHALLRFGEMIRNRGRVGVTQVLSPLWIDKMWTPRTRSVASGDAYGFGWYLREMRGRPTYYAWGYGGQMLYIVPDLGLTVVITSADDRPAGRSGYVRKLHRLVSDYVIPAAEAEGGA
jgi:CubicO group peptidase (beta-lactamase class C family)